MSRRRYSILAAVVGLAVLGGVAGWYWKTRPARQVAAVRSALASGEYGRAEALLAPLLKEREEESQIHLLHAQALRHQKRYGEAGIALERAMKRGLDRDVGARELALQLAPQDWPPEAEGVLKQVVKDRPDDVELLAALAAGYARRGRWKEAFPLCTALVKLEPDEPEHLALRGQVNMNEMHFTEAIDDFRRVLASRPEHFLARLYLANSLLSDARLAEAEVELRACQKLRPDRVEPLVGLVNCAVERGDVEAAESYLSQAVALDRASPMVLHEVVNMHLRRERFDLAQEVLEAMLKTAPDDKQIHLKLAQIFRRTGNNARASQHRRRYQELDQLEEMQSRGMR